MNTWDQIYNLLGIREFIYLISSPSIQEVLFPVKLVFIFFTIFFLVAVIYFYRTSSYIQYKFMQDVSEFLSWEAYGFKEINKRWKKIMKKTESGAQADYKMAIIEADDILYKALEDAGYEGETFEELVEKAGRKIGPGAEDILEAHTVRNSIVYEPDYELDTEKARKILSDVEIAVKNVMAS